MDKPQKDRSRLVRSMVTIVAIILASIFLSYMLISNAIDLFGINKPDQQIEITITPGMSAAAIAKELGNKGVIEHALTFRVYAGIRNSADHFQAGDYILNSRMAYDEIIIALSTGSTIKNEVTLTFYEGISLREIADLLEDKQVCSAEDFINCTQSVEFGFEFEQMLPENKNRFRRLEGYLFPDTYNFYVGENVQSVVKKFLKNFSNKIPDDLYQKMQNAGMTLDQVVTLASVIQEEASDVKEMSKVSSVFHNRLGAPGAYPNLQSDVTIFYVNNDIKPFLDIKNDELYNAYDTYTCVGLPVGPICSPGLDAILAAISPEKTDYYFFVTDANKKYYYATTAEKHYQNVRAAAKVKAAVPTK